MLKSAVSNPTSSTEDPGPRIGAYPDVEGGLRRGGQVSVASPSQAGERGVTRMSRVTRQEWAPSVLIFLLDILTWIAIYGMASYLRNDTAFSVSFQFAVIEIIQIAVIVQALFIIGGYNPRTETRGLAYTAEHILALLCAFGGSLSTKLNDMSRRYGGIILAERAEVIRSDLLDRLIPTQFQRIRVYTLESFYEAHWRQVPAHSIDPFLPMQAGFQLSRASP